MSENLKRYAATRKPVPYPTTPFSLLKDASRDNIIPDVDTADVLTLSTFSAQFLKLDIRGASSIAEIINILRAALSNLLTLPDRDIHDLYQRHDENKFLTTDSNFGCTLSSGALGFNEQSIIDGGYEIDPADQPIPISVSETISDPDSLRQTFLQKWRLILKFLEE